MLELKSLSVAYGKKTVLDNINATFEKGKLISVIGTNGCGKSTLLRTALGLISPTRGSVILDGCDLSTLHRSEIARKISYLPQGKSVPDMNVEQLVLHGRFPYLSYPRRYTAADREIARTAMQTVGILDLASHRIDTLSGGMRQNAYIAMALAQNTDYILLDEPTTYLDIAHQLYLMQLLKKLASGGKCIITVTHELPLAFEFSDGILLLDGGKIAGYAEPENLLNQEALHKAFKVKIKSLDGKGKYYYEV